MSFLDLYKPELKIRVVSILTDGLEYEMDWQNNHLQQPLHQAFLEDANLQEMTLCSSSLGFVRTYTKQYKE